MGYSRPRPKHLAAKLLRIRQALGLSQRQLAKRLNAGIPHNNISKYELNKNEPPLVVLLAYARLAEIPVEQIIDDAIDFTHFREHSAALQNRY
jgi:transcriptional regulator with XRE-family HTH domain